MGGKIDFLEKIVDLVRPTKFFTKKLLFPAN